MNRSFPVLAFPLAALLAPLVGGSGAAFGAAPTAAKLSFNDHFQPILADNCYACHGIDAGSRKAELRLDGAEHATAKRKEGGPAIVPGKPDEGRAGRGLALGFGVER